ncbi:forkhead box protein P1 isoform X16 [Vespula maculifrons]|uniref:Forkhead box protein P1 isoform X16 n=1 Tax=Vespula maculifrons TaxID=7453 RepID=A0ABD2CBS0_VESMC
MFVGNDKNGSGIIIKSFPIIHGHIGENPFDNGSWGKEHFQPSTVPWQLNPRGHSRPSVSKTTQFFLTILLN